MYNNCIYKILIDNSCLKNDIISPVSIIDEDITFLLNNDDILCVPIKKLNIKIEEIVNENNKILEYVPGVIKHSFAWDNLIVENTNIYLTEMHVIKFTGFDVNNIKLSNPNTYRYAKGLLKNDIADLFNDNKVPSCEKTIKLLYFRRISHYSTHRNDMFLNESEIADLLRLNFFRPYLLLQSDETREPCKINLLYKEGDKFMKEPGDGYLSKEGILYISLYRSFKYEYLEKNKCFFNNSIFYGINDKFHADIEKNNFKWVSVKLFVTMENNKGIIIRIFLRIDKNRISLPVNKRACRFLAGLFPEKYGFPPELLKIRGDIYISYYFQNIVDINYQDNYSIPYSGISYIPEMCIDPDSLKISYVLCDIYPKLSDYCVKDKLNYFKCQQKEFAEFMFTSPGFCAKNLIKSISSLGEDDKKNRHTNFDDEIRSLTLLYDSITDRIEEIKKDQKNKRFEAIGRKLENRLSRKYNKFKTIDIPLKKHIGKEAS